MEDVKQLPYLPQIVSGDRPEANIIVMGYDEQSQKWVKVQYRWDSNRFFDYPYTGSVYPFERMSKYKLL